ncbi:MAG TPA: AI-2E family transporter [Dermatophilaceae bacterium]|nr:AI-2E family transporter [Dermatophilaceae bacterium]
MSPLREHATDTVSWGFQVTAAWALRFLIVMAALFVLLTLLNAVSLVTITVIVAIMICALLQPLVGLLTRYHVPRTLAAVLVFVLGMSALVAAAWFVVQQVSANSTALGSQLLDAVGTIRKWLVTGPPSMSEHQVTQLVDDVTRTVTENRASLAQGAFATANSAFLVVGGTVFCMFATLFLLTDDGGIFRWIVRLFPDEGRAKVTHAGNVAWRTLIAYMRSTVLLALINSLTMVVIMLIAGMPLVIPLGVLLFLGSMIPLIGMLVAGVVVVLVALVTKSLVMAVVMAVALVLTVQLEGNLLNPLILGKAVQIHPLGILMAVTAGTILGGIFGAFIAVPLVAIVNNVANDVHGRSPTDPAPTPQT